MRVSAITSIVLALGAALFATATNIAVANDEIELRVLHYQSSAGNAVAFRAILDDFEAEHANIRVTEVVTNAAGIANEAQAALAARRPFDVIQALNRLALGAITTLGARPFSEAPDGGVFSENFAPSIRDAGLVDGDRYLAPHSFGTPLLYYNRDVMAAAGLDPASPPSSFQEMAEMARRVVEVTDIQGFWAGGAHDYTVEQMLLLAGSPYIAGTRAAFNTAEAVEVLDFMQQAVLDGLMPNVAFVDGTNLFSAGELGFMVSTSAILRSTLRNTDGNFAVGIAEVPVWKDRARRVPNSGSGMMVTAQEPARIAAAFELLEFLSRPEITNRWSRETGYLPLAVDPLADPVMQDFVAMQPEYQVLVRQLGQTVPTTLWPSDRGVEAQAVVANLLGELWQNEGSAATLVPRAADEVTRILDPSR